MRQSFLWILDCNQSGVDLRPIINSHDRSFDDGHPPGPDRFLNIARRETVLHHFLYFIAVDGIHEFSQALRTVALHLSLHVLVANNLLNNKRMYRISKLNSTFFFHALVCILLQLKNHLRTSILAHALLVKDIFACTLKALAQRMHEVIDKSREQHQNTDS